MGEVNIRRLDIPRSIAHGKAPGSPGPLIRMMLEQQVDLEASWNPKEQVKSAQISGTDDDDDDDVGLKEWLGIISGKDDKGV